MHASWRPMSLVRIPDPFDHPDWLFELKYDGFRALAHVEGHRCTLVSRRGHVFTKFSLLAEEIAHSVQADRAVLDGEIVCLGPDGRTHFYDLLFRREWPFFSAFDLFSHEDQDLRGRPLIERKRQLHQLIPRTNSRLLYVDHIEAQASVYSVKRVRAILIRYARHASALANRRSNSATVCG